MVVHGAPSGAVVYVDGVAAARIGPGPSAIRVLPGVHLLRIDASGHLPHRDELELEAGATYDVTVELWPCFPEVDRQCVTETAAPFPQRDPAPPSAAGD